jgi:hypothetical protein
MAHHLHIDNHKLSAYPGIRSPRHRMEVGATSGYRTHDPEEPWPNPLRMENSKHLKPHV